MTSSSQCVRSSPGQCCRGVAAVEFALLLPLLFFVFLATVDYCRVFYYSVAVGNCARNGALYGSADKSHALDASGIRTAARADAGDLNPEKLTVSSSTDNTTKPSYVSVTASYTFTTITQYPGIPKQTSLTRTVRMNVLPLTPNFN
jgi:Flp pilus assembly protein TadG